MFTPELKRTAAGTSYYQEPGLVCVAATQLYRPAIRTFLADFSEKSLYADDLQISAHSDCDLLPMMAGQLCYLSFGEKRTSFNDIAKYLGHIKDCGHGSVLEHASVTVLLWGVSRSLTHELVRHRAGFAFSQVSQRYCGGETLRFVEGPESVVDPKLHTLFEQDIDTAREKYEERCDILMAKQSDLEILSGEAKTELRKKVRGAARRILPNCTEAPIMVTANLRAWRHFLNMRASAAAEVEIRRVAVGVWDILKSCAYNVFNDFELLTLPDGTQALHTDYPKV